MNHFIEKLHKVFSKERVLLINLVWRAVQLFGRQGMLFIIFFVSAKLLSPVDLGKLSYLLSLISLLSIFSDFGLSTAVSKYTAEFSFFEDGREKIKALFFSSIGICLFFCFVVSILVISVGRFFLDAHDYGNLLLLIPLIFFIPVQSVFDGIFRGLNNYKKVAVITLISGLCSIPIVWFLAKEFGLQGAILGQLVFYFLGCIALLFVFEHYSFRLDRKVIRMVLSYSIVIGFTNLSYFFLTKIGVIFLGMHHFTEFAGYYEMINRISTAILNIFAALGVVMAAPNVHRMLSKDTGLLLDVKKLTKNLFLGGLVLTIAVVSVTIFSIHIFLPLYFNKDFLMVAVLLFSTLPLYIIEAVLSNGFITPLGFAKILLKATAGGAIATIIFSLILIQYIGPLGVLITVAIVNNGVNIYKIVSFRKELIMKFEN